ncbi:choice-of-anchor M domain-containing protein [Corynebacterium cystitidis]|uniref:choice-of-anchor M domain-containing protein n=1 Tax=Corynebacterium cystitidis TaxID=35757 RepID=UPI00211E64B1|nr:choice-of-anchor M domain-containing protein [Corynebacterium cystitidis]
MPDEGFFDDFGAPGQTYYMAPQSAFMFNYPTWWGYGADTGIPTESFRHGIGALDLLSVKGPGQVEMFFDQGRQFGPKRQLGSGDKSPHTVPIVKGTHEHAATIFTKPGRYVLEYQASAHSGW